MCGIAGVLFKDCVHHDKALLKSMLHVISHRGPDDEGVYLYGNVGLGHRRLSIIDTSAAGHQPMKYGNLVITYNGEIYNYIEIRKELVTLGHIFVTGTDTEVILHAYKEWGKECQNRFTGMWAFAILDEDKDIIFCSRDHFGIKPFYYYRSDDRWAFSSEIKALLEVGAPARVNYKCLMDYLVLGVTDHREDTFFQGISQLLPGRCLTVGLFDGTFEIEKYYDLSGSLYRECHSEDYISCIKQSVRLHLRSDVPVGACLSGGLDSSVIAALSSSINRESGNDRFSAVTARSESPDKDETPFARQVVDHCGLDWHIAYPVYDDFLREIESCLYFQEEPVLGPSVYLQYGVMKTAKDVGMKVMLDGQGGDETLLGYERYYVAYFWDLLKRGKYGKTIHEYLMAARHSKLSLFGLAAYAGYFSLSTLRKKVLSKRACFLKDNFLNIFYPTLAEIGGAFFDLRKLQISEIGFQQLPHLLKYEDRNSMAHSIEARVPYVERNCIETALFIPSDEIIVEGYTKYPLRKLAERILPQSIAWRREKIGFEAPTKIWLKRHRPIMDKKVRSSHIIRQICKYIPDLGGLTEELQWRLYNIAIWERLYNVQA